MKTNESHPLSIDEVIAAASVIDSSEPDFSTQWIYDADLDRVVSLRDLAPSLREFDGAAEDDWFLEKSCILRARRGTVTKTSVASWKSW